MWVPQILKHAFDRLLSVREAGPLSTRTVEVDRNELIQCVMNETATTEKTNAFIGSRWGEVAGFIEDGLSVARPLNELEAGYVDAIRTVEQAMFQAGSYDQKINVSRTALETLVRDSGLAYVAKNAFMARMGDMPFGVQDELEITQTSLDTTTIKFAPSPEKLALRQKQDRLAMFVINTRDALGPYVPETAAGIHPAAEF